MSGIHVKPPLGVRPRYIAESERRLEIANAITRYLIAGYPLPDEWVAEYNELITRKEPR